MDDLSKAGKMMGSLKSQRKAEAARFNGLKGGRKREKDTVKQTREENECMGGGEEDFEERISQSGNYGL